MDLDLKTIGLAAKDIIIGVGTAAAGASGGPAAAEGVGKAGSGLDRILGMAGVLDSRADKFDRADFAARPSAGKSTGPVEAKPVASALPPAPPAPVPVPGPTEEPAQSTRSEDGPHTGDEKRAVEHLQRLGWPYPKIRQILSGPDHTSLAAVVGKETKGVRARGAPGTPLPQTRGTALPAADGRAVATVDGRRLPRADGLRVTDNDQGRG